MNYGNHNNPITRLAMPEQVLPILIPWGEEGRTGEFTFGNVRRLGPSDLELYLNSRRLFETKFGKVDQSTGEELRFLLELAQAISQRSASKLKTAVVRAFGDEKQMAAFRALPLMSLSAKFNWPLRNSHAVVWWSDIAKRLLLGIWCSDVNTALFMLAVAKVGYLSDLGICKRCRELFTRLRPAKQYCSANCQSAAGMSRLRKRRGNKKRNP
jgi:hypothetical protein